MAGTVKNNASKSIFWSAIERLSVQSASFILSIIIARLVLPSDYGLIAMLAIFISLAQTFVDSGFSNALIQKQDRTEADFSTVFYFNIIVSLIIYLLLFFCAPLIAAFYNEPILTNLTKWVSLSFVLSSFAVVQRAKLTIIHDFKTQAIVSFASVIISGFCGIIAAAKGLGVWALVIQTLVNQGLTTVLFWVVAKWRPKYGFSIVSFRSLFGFGSKLLVSGIINTLYTHMYTIVIGKVYSSKNLGYYSKANNLGQFAPIAIANILHKALYPYQCEIQNENERLHSFFLTYLSMASFVSFPICFMLITISLPFVDCVLTEKWLPIVPLMRILCIAYMWYPISYINCQILNVKGRSDLFLKAEIIKKIFAVLLLLCCLPFGIEALCWSLVVYHVMDVVILIPFIKKVMQTGFFEEIKQLLPSFLLSSLTGLIIFLLLRIIPSSFMQLLVGTVLYFVLYILMAKLLRMKEIDNILGFLKIILNRK